MFATEIGTAIDTIVVRLETWSDWKERRRGKLRLSYFGWIESHLHPTSPEPCCPAGAPLDTFGFPHNKQADHGVSLEAQQAKIRAMATVHGAEIAN